MLNDRFEFSTAKLPFCLARLLNVLDSDELRIMRSLDNVEEIVFGDYDVYRAKARLAYRLIGSYSGSLKSIFEQRAREIERKRRFFIPY